MNDKELGSVYDLYENWSEKHKCRELILINHLITEDLLEALIEKQLKYPEKINLSRINIPIKVDFCIAFGIIDENRRHLYKGLNRIRNKIAHQFDYIISYEELLDLLKIISNIDKIHWLIHDYERSWIDNMEKTKKEIDLENFLFFINLKIVIDF